MSPLNESLPYIVAGWEITSQCNLRCPHCYTAASTHPRRAMGTDECRQVIDAMAGIGVGLIGWTGGEPLLREDLCELTVYAGDKGMRCNITTNGVLLDRQKAQGMADAGMRGVQISLDGSTPERNRYMRGATDEEFFRILDGIRFCKEANLYVYLACVLGEENLDDAPRMIELAARQGADVIRFCGYTPVGRGRRKIIKDRLAFTQDDRLLEFVAGADANSPIPVEFDSAFGPVPPTYRYHECKAGVGTFYLKENGDIYPCTSMSHPRFRVGNIRKRPLAEIWASEEMSAMSRYPREQVEEPCRSCDNYTACHGACRAGAFQHTGNLDAAYPHCLYLAAVKRDRET